MKKIYKTPETEVTMIAPASMIANSPFTFSEDGNSGSGTVTDEDATDEALVKGRGTHNVWDDDWSR